jgi:hypothetical protein
VAAAAAAVAAAAEVCLHAVRPTHQGRCGDIGSQVLLMSVDIATHKKWQAASAADSCVAAVQLNIPGLQASLLSLGCSERHERQQHQPQIRADGLLHCEGIECLGNRA